MAKKNRARKIVNNAATNKTATTPVKEPTSPVEEKATVTEEVTETVAETTVETTEKVETVVKETTTAADEAVPQETEEKEAPKSFLDDPDLIDDQDPETQEEPEPAPETEGNEEFDEDSMFADTPVDRIETITCEEYKKALRKRFFMESGVSMESYKVFINAVTFGLMSDYTITGIAYLLMQMMYEEDRTSYNLKAIEAFIKFGLMGRKESAETYLPDEDMREILDKKSWAMDQLSERQDKIILQSQLDIMLENFFGLVFAKPVFSPDDIKRREEEAAKAKAKAEKAAEKAAKAAEKAAKKESKKKAPEADAADEAATPQETEETSQEKSEPETKKKEKFSFKDKIAAAKEKAVSKKAAKEAAKEEKKVTEEDVTDSTAEPCVE